MEESVFSAGGVEEAIAAGLEVLGLSREQVEVEVLDEGSRGVLGIGSRPARVRLTPIAAPPPAEAAPAAAETPAAPPPLPEALKPAADTARQILDDLLRLMGLPAEIRVRQDEADTDGEEGPLVLDIYGPGVDMLLAHKNEGLDALQRITRILVNQRVATWTNLVIDVEGYKQRRRQMLQRLARQMAERALKERRRVALEPMPAYERRIVHLTLRQFEGVRTESEGMEDRRRVVIIPR